MATDCSNGVEDKWKTMNIHRFHKLEFNVSPLQGIVALVNSRVNWAFGRFFRLSSNYNASYKLWKDKFITDNGLHYYKIMLIGLKNVDAIYHTEFEEMKEKNLIWHFSTNRVCLFINEIMPKEILGGIS